MLSDETIADESGGGSTRNVKRARERLRRLGWLTWHHTQTANVYRLERRQVSGTLDAMILSRESRRSRHLRWKPKTAGPWEAEGVSRATWYRRGAVRRFQSDSRVPSETVSE